MVSGISKDILNGSGTRNIYGISDDLGHILVWPQTLVSVEGVDSDEAKTGACLILCLLLEDGLQGLAMGMYANDLIRCLICLLQFK